MDIRCAIIDDEAIAIAVLDKLLLKIPGIKVVAKCQSAIEAYSILKNQVIDLLFLDIEMPDLTGIDFLKTLDNPPKVIITSANKNFAIEGFELNVMDYIIKPVTLNRLLKAVNKLPGKEDVSVVQAGDVEIHVDSSEFIYVKENKKMVKVFIDNIEYIESIKDYSRIITTRKKVVTKQQLSFFEEKLDNTLFLRIHRSIIVSVKRIESYGSSFVEIAGIELPIGRSYKEKVISELKKLAHL
ncbi:MAG: response regulator transcription factor [Chlorobi bacterium]|nr:response regulator transcription factor [Chlorobiota bacterium]